MSKNCTPLSREAHFEVKMLKNWRSRTTFSTCDVTKLHAAVARRTFPSQNVQNISGSDHFLKFRCGKIARSCSEKHIFKSKCQLAQHTTPIAKTHGTAMLFASEPTENLKMLINVRHRNITNHDQNITAASPPVTETPKYHRHRAETSPTQNQGIIHISPKHNNTITTHHRDTPKTSPTHPLKITKTSLAHAENILTHHQRITETSPRYHQIIHETQTKHNRDLTETSPKHHQDIIETELRHHRKKLRHYSNNEHITDTKPETSPTYHQSIAETRPTHHWHITQTRPTHHWHKPGTSPRHHWHTKNITKTSLKHHWNSTETSRRHPRDKTTQLRPHRNIQNSTNYTETTPRHHRDKEASSVDIRPTAFCHSYTGLPKGAQYTNSNWNFRFCVESRSKCLSMFISLSPKNQNTITKAKNYTSIDPKQLRQYQWENRRSLFPTLIGKRVVAAGFHLPHHPNTTHCISQMVNYMLRTSYCISDRASCMSSTAVVIVALVVVAVLKVVVVVAIVVVVVVVVVVEVVVVVVLVVVVVVVIVIVVVVVVVDVIQPTLHIAYGRLHAANLELHIANGIHHAPYVIPHISSRKHMSSTAYPIWHTACRIPYSSSSGSRGATLIVVLVVVVIVIVVVVVVLVVVVDVIRPTVHIACGRLHAATLELHIANGITHATYVIPHIPLRKLHVVDGISHMAHLMPHTI